MRNYLINELGDISNSPELQGKANQILSSFFAKQGWNQDVSDQFRADVLNAMGVETGFYENKFKDALDNAVNTSFPWIGDKIRNNQELTDAEKVQVSNMMKDAAAQVKKIILCIRRLKANACSRQIRGCHSSRIQER